MRRLDIDRMVLFLPALLVALFSVFPLTDTDIWWHLACAREWVNAWTPVRTPVVNVHEYFQAVVAFVYGVGGVPLLVALKAVLWGVVFALFTSWNGCDKHHCEPSKNVIASLAGAWQSLVAVLVLFIFRYHFEIRPVLFTLLFLGIYWKVLPGIFAVRHCESHGNTDLAFSGCVKRHCEPRRGAAISRGSTVAIILAIQWFWCKCQGLYILGPLFALLVLLVCVWNSRRVGEKLSTGSVAWRAAFVLGLFSMPFLHCDGLNLFLYPFGLLDRLLGLSPSAAVFASEIAENRSPFRLLVAGENVLECVLMIALCFLGFFVGLRRLLRPSPCIPPRATEGSEAISRRLIQNIALLVTASLALVAERNFVLFLPLLLGTACELRFVGCAFGTARCRSVVKYTCFIVIAFCLGLWARSLAAYDYSMVAYQRVPVDAAEWMRQNPHAGRLFNDDRAGGYLAFVNPADSIYMDGRFILKTAEFFGRYLEYANNPSLFIADADSLNIDRAIFPLRYYARWGALLQTLEKSPRWHLAYRDDYFAVFDKF